jgi:hypothetical protein
MDGRGKTVNSLLTSTHLEASVFQWLRKAVRQQSLWTLSELAQGGAYAKP